jgi:hypothetical protein
MSSVFVERHGKKRKFRADLAYMQISYPQRISQGGARCTMYYSPESGDIWVRPEAEFLEKFEHAATSESGIRVYRHKGSGSCYEKIDAWLWPTNLNEFQDCETVYVLSEVGSTSNKKYLIKYRDLKILYKEEEMGHPIQDKQKEGILANRIEIAEQKNGMWKATLRKMTSATESDVFEVEAPSQTMLLEIIRVVFGMKRSKKIEE